MFKWLRVWWYARDLRRSRYDRWYAVQMLSELQDARSIKTLIEALDKGGYDVAKWRPPPLGG